MDLPFYLHLMRYVLIVGPLMAGVCALLSVFVVLRRMAMISEAVAHAGLGGLALSLLLGYWWNFANGQLGDFFCHYCDLAFWALKLRAPLTVAAEGPPPHPEIAPASMHAIYEYPARAEMPPVTVHWYRS